jgi:hypothetical protein
MVNAPENLRGPQPFERVTGIEPFICVAEACAAQREETCE